MRLGLAYLHTESTATDSDPCCRLLLPAFLQMKYAAAGRPAAFVIEEEVQQACNMHKLFTNQGGLASMAGLLVPVCEDEVSGQR